MEEDSRPNPWPWRLTRALVVIVISVIVLASGCAYSSQLIPTQPSGVTQQLMTRSLERALMQVDLTGLVGKQVSLDVFTQTGNQAMLGGNQPPPSQAFVKEFVAIWLAAQGVPVTPEAMDLQLKVAASVLGTDRGESFVGIRAFQIPILAIPFPEIALFRWVRNRGVAEIWMYAFDPRTRGLVGQILAGIGRSKQDDFTILLMIDFTVSDVDQRPLTYTPDR